MPINLELKCKVGSLRKFRLILRKAGGEYRGVLTQKDIYFKNNRALLKLRLQKEKNELIKYNRDESGRKRWSYYEILNVSGKALQTSIRAVSTFTVSPFIF